MNPTHSSLLLLSGATTDDLRARCETVLTSLDDHANHSASLDDLQSRLAVATPGRHRLAVVVSTVGETRRALHRAIDLLPDLPDLPDDPADPTDAADSGRWYAATVTDTPQRVAFLYPGQGAQRVGDQRILATLDPVFADRCAELLDSSVVPGLQPLMTAGWPETEDRTPLDSAPLDNTAINMTDAAQTVLTVLGVAATELFARLGVRPGLATGHSVGEFSALHAVGGLTAEEAVRLASERGRIMRAQLSDGEYGMVALRCSGAEAAALAESAPGVYPTCWNDGHQTVYGGTKEAFEPYVEACRAAGILATPLPAQGPFHTPLMAASRPDFAALLDDAALAAPTGHFVSTVSGHAETDPAAIRERLADQVTTPVDFRAAGVEILAAAPDVVVQLSGGESLLRMLRHDHPESSFVGVGFGGTNDNRDAVLHGLARLFVTLPGIHLAPVLAHSGVAARWRLQDVRLDRHSVIKLSAVAPHRADDPAPTQPAHPVPTANRTPRMTGSTERTTAPTAPTATAHDTTADRSRITTRGLPIADPLPTTAAAPAAQPDAVSLEAIRTALLTAMAEASSSPIAEIARGGRLAEDLGFDSLLMADTLRRLSQQVPDLRATDLALENVRTLDDLTAELARVVGASSGPTPDMDAHPAPEAFVLPDSCERTLASFPELAAFERKQAEFAATEALVPYYLPHDGIISNHTEIEGHPMISFSSYNYLGMSEDPQVQAAVVDAVHRYGTSVSAARILSGNRPLHDELEHEIADFLGSEDAVVLVGGHATNASIVPQVVAAGDIVFHDSLAHDSIQQGIRASGAARHSFPHNDMDALGTALARRRGSYRRALICVEGAYSMDGDTVPLAEIVALKERYGALLMVDEAHSFGTMGATGRGICEASGVSPSQVDILMGTLSKSMASCGGYIGGSHRFVEFLRYNLSSLVFSAGLSPANTAAALASLRVLRREPERVQRLLANADYFRTGVDRLGLDWGDGAGTPIVPVIYGDSARTLRVANALYRKGISINPILAPAVAERLTRLRVFVTAMHTREDLDAALEALAEISDATLVGASA
ncbi:aminotransferase class I/II-fold pyridoxal phosphate-dependent enzyme [Raineyella sp. LH-20]|uniref:aminotransferase class I/II-fold pyridoxal phosphate-dependent enzyme n=1 Tax=Raineyella sp. LH-20 TaxID=3081204 RepID=UPI0029554405|nr:aminotransferase class I/II-fold pyridoxal phosphate-dependent enzyme [Raineyella sp. LH-20]WOP17587.1 aminotransferase class I/II-fold pyridoxal phosphate-dependent enzyme [Raineyella sp. LH-20]